MEGLYEWIRNLIICICLLELCGHLVRSGDYRRYIRFYGGLVLLLLVFEPAGELFSIGDIFEEALRQAFTRESAFELQTSQEALAGLQSREIEKAYRVELERQIREIIKAHGRQSISIKITFREAAGQPSQIAGVQIVLMPVRDQLNVFAQDADSSRQQAGVEQIREELASVYGISRGSITVSVKE